MRAILSPIFNAFPEQAKTIFRLAGLIEDQPVLNEYTFTNSGLEIKDLLEAPNYENPEHGVKIWLQGEIEPIDTFLVKINDDQWANFINYVKKENPAYDTQDLNSLRKKLKPISGQLIKSSEDLTELVQDLLRFAIKFRGSLYKQDATDAQSLSTDPGSIGFPINTVVFRPGQIAEWSSVDS